MAVGAAFSKRQLLDLDPDYTDGHLIETKRRCLAEETGQEQAQQHVAELVVHELDVALAQKESEALELQERVHSCQRILHVLRYGITSAYYKDLGPEEGPSHLHPAVSRILGYTTALLDGPKTRGKSMAEEVSDEEGEEDSSAEESCDFLQPPNAKNTDCSIKLEVEEEQEETISETKTKDDMEKNVEKPMENVEETVLPKVPRYVPPIMPDPPTVCATSVRMERHRIKRRLVVGNISKWLPEDVRVNAASHKWMMYVRGPKDAPDISDIVSKVRYFLHPSYRPHDIAEVSHPFYLSRRGWGEFPVRVQVHFCLSGNRPIDIIHNLKLDRTYSGLQTSGGETVVDVWLKSLDQEPNVKESNVDTEQQKVEKKATTAMPTTVFSDGHNKTVVHKEPLLTTGAVNCSSTVQEKAMEKDSKNQPQETACQLESAVDTTKESCEKEKFLPSTVNGFVHHIVPDHDYLGHNTFRMKCHSCTEQQCPEDLHDNAPLKEQEKHLINGKTRCSQPTTLLPSSDPIIFSEQLKGLLQNMTLSAKDIETTIKVEDSGDTARGACGFRKKTPGTKNGVASSTSLVQCVDDKGTIFYISLQKPSTANCDFSKDSSSKLDIALDTPLLQHSTMLGSNADSYVDEAKILVASNGAFQTKSSVPATSLMVGRSLLKKNCLASSSTSSPSSPSATVPSETINMQNIIEFVDRKPVLGRLHARSLKTEPAPEPAVQLKEVVARLVSKMTDDRQIVTWLLQQLPLVDEQAGMDPVFKKHHPYCAPNVHTFLSWSAGKRHSAERLRANAAYAILQTVSDSRFVKWSVRHIMRWARLYALSPIPLRKYHGRQAEPKVHSATCSSVNPTVSEPTEVRDWLESVSEASKAAEEMEEVDIEGLVAPRTDVKTSVCKDEDANSAGRLMPPNTALCEFVQSTVEQLGIHITAEMLSPGVLYPAVEQLLFRACQSLCEDLLRRSVYQAWRRCQQMPNEIVQTDTQNALLSRCEFDVFTNAGLGVQAYDTSDYS